MIQETSIESYNNIDNLGQRQLEVYNCLKKMEYANNTMIAKEMRLPISSITPRVRELVKKSLVRQSHKSWCPYTRRRVIYWTLTKSKEEKQWEQ